MSDPHFTGDSSADQPVSGAAVLSDAVIGVVVFVATAIPTLIAALLKPELLLDDIEFAARARFEGWSGFVHEMGYRPGQGLIHAMQFNLIGERPAVHLLVLALGNATAAWLFWRLLSLTVPRPIALATITAFVVLPNRGSLRFWTSTLPNHVAMCLLLGSAIVAAIAIKKMLAERLTGSDTPDHSAWAWIATSVMSLLSIVTYEATISLAPFITLALAFTSRTRRGRFVLPAAIFGLFGIAALVLKARSPRAGATTFFARPFDAVPKHLNGIAPRPFVVVGVLVVVGCALWALVTVARDGRQASHHAKLAFGGTIIALAGLAPFTAAGFNIQSEGVLDRAHYFPTLGTALLLGAALHMLYRSVDSIAVRPLLLCAVALSLVGVARDLEPYVRSADEFRQAEAAVAELVPPDDWTGDDAWTESDQGVRIADPPAAGGVGWGFYSAQLRDLYRLVHNAPEDPWWLALGQQPENDVPPNLAYFDVENGELVDTDATD